MKFTSTKHASYFPLSPYKKTELKYEKQIFIRSMKMTNCSSGWQ